MFIDITEKPAARCWVVCMDALEVNFNSLGEAQAFVGQLKARIEAPHVWPSSPGPAGESRQMPARPAAHTNGKGMWADRVE